MCRCAELNEKQRELEEAEVTLTSPVAERNGPLQVATEYDVLMSNTWQDAKSALDQYSDWKVKEKDKYEILTSTLLVTSHYRTTSTPRRRLLMSLSCAGVLPSGGGSARKPR